MNSETLDYHINLIYNTVTEPDRWLLCLEKIAATINARTAMIGVDDIKSKTSIASQRYGFSEHELEALKIIRSKDVWVHRLLQLQHDSFLYNEQILPQKEYKASEMYAHYGKPYDMHHTIGLYLEKTAGQALRIAFQRGQSQGAYSQKEVDYLDRLLPHIKRAVQLSKNFLTTDLSNKLNRKALQEQTHGLAILDQYGQIMMINDALESIFVDQNWLEVKNNHLLFTKGLSNNDYLGAIASLTRPEKLQTMQGTVPFLINGHSESGRESWLLEFSRFQSDPDSTLSPILGFGPEPLVMLTIKNLTSQSPNIKTRLKTLHKLSDSEIEIALGLSKGYCPKDIAESRSRSIETIRTQIKQITTKIGVRSSNALISHINQLAS